MSSDWFDGGGSGSPADVAGILDGQPAQGLRELVELGALVSMGTTSDGGALGVTVTVDGRWRREYFRSSDELLTWIGEAIPAVEAAKGAKSPSGAQRQRPRRSRGL